MLQCPVDNFLRLFERNPQCSQLAELAHFVVGFSRSHALQELHLLLSLQGAALPLLERGFAWFGHAAAFFLRGLLLRKSRCRALMPFFSR